MEFLLNTTHEDLRADKSSGAPPVFGGGQNRSGLYLAKHPRVKLFLGFAENTECSSAWLERHVRDVEVGGSNPLTPIEKGTRAGAFFYGIHGPAGHPGIRHMLFWP